MRTLSSQRTGGRLLALLLALLFAMVTLSSHGAMESPQVDCGIAAEWISVDGHLGEGHNIEHDHEASSCVTCFTTTVQAQLPVVGPQRQAITLAMAVLPQFPLPPRRPPRA
ncbi:hypothetical protein [Halomonas korlensis]|uniref:DUF2946 domain-containing protein n=1 Tax=Halomonas korlensis TaxID=463301 RepID=A0A1I7KFN9_9GAMM|nr:hypothetical protein [Halomonas korlensis]SFU96263.1 hypothetical protein SAMN04487955_11930 [Halomonas korlensis]